ncbi:MAG: hypothetical protein U0Y82_03630 [Thermoleophilia bacterium]
MLMADPTLAAVVRTDDVPLLLAPRVSPPLTPAQAVGLDLILEGFLVHHGTPRALTRADEEPHGVLAGDYCYASGLVEVSASGDLFVIRALALLVAHSAGLVAAGRREVLPDLWLGTVAAIAGPRTPVAQERLDAAFRAVLAGDPEPLADLAATLADPPDLDAVFA